MSVFIGASPSVLSSALAAQAMVIPHSAAVARRSSRRAASFARFRKDSSTAKKYVSQRRAALVGQSARQLGREGRLRRGLLDDRTKRRFREPSRRRPEAEGERASLVQSDHALGPSGRGVLELAGGQAVEKFVADQQQRGVAGNFAEGSRPAWL